MVLNDRRAARNTLKVELLATYVIFKEKNYCFKKYLFFRNFIVFKFVKEVKKNTKKTETNVNKYFS